MHLVATQIELLAIWESTYTFFFLRAEGGIMMTAFIRRCIFMAEWCLFSWQGSRLLLKQKSSGPAPVPTCSVISDHLCNTAMIAPFLFAASLCTFFQWRGLPCESADVFCRDHIVKNITSYNSLHSSSARVNGAEELSPWLEWHWGRLLVCFSVALSHPFWFTLHEITETSWV